VRLFLALNFPDELRRAIHDATAPLRAAAPAVSWVDAARLHLTLKFLGEQPAEVVGPLAQSLRAVAAAHAPLALAIGGLGAFPERRRPRVVWIGVAPDPKLELLHHDVETACGALGYEVEGRAFRPHVTLGRIRPAGRGRRPDLEPAVASALADAAREVYSRWTADVGSVDLMESVLSSGGSRYRVLHAAPLGG